MESVIFGQLRNRLLDGLKLDIADRNLSIAIIGFGKMGLLHSSILNLLKPGIVKFIVDRSRVITIGGSLLVKNIKFFRSVERLLKEDVDAIYITSPTQTHYAVASRLIEAGVKAIFIEKPPTVDLTCFMELLEDAKRCLTMVGFQKRYALPFRHTKLLLDKGIVGDVRYVKCYIKSGDVLQPTKRFTSLGRGVLLDLGIHVLDLLCWFFGDISVESAKCKSLYTGVDDVFMALLSTEEVSIEFESTWSDSSFRLPETFIEIRGEKGIIKASEDYVKVELNGKSSALYKPNYYQGFPPVLVADPEYTIEDTHFLSCLTKGAKPQTSLESCVATMELMEKLYRRIYHG